MEEKKVPLMSKFFSNLIWVELTCLAGVSIALLLGSKELLFGTSLALAAVFYLYAFKPSIAGDVKEKSGFMDLLILTILPKILGISTAVNIVGILFFLNGLKGANKMLFIGLTSVGGAFIILLFSYFTDSEKFTIHPILYRAIPVAVAALYVLFFMR